MKSNFICISRVQRPHGFRGAFVASKINTVDRIALNELEAVWVRQGTEISGPYKIQEAAEMPKGWKLTLEGIESESALAPLRGADLVIPSHLLPALRPGEYFIDQLVGMEVVDSTTKKRIGSLQGVELVVARGGTQGLDRWWVRRDEGPPFAFPPAKYFLVQVDVPHQKIFIQNWMELVEE